MNRWFLLVYRVPREPTSGRVFIWRKLKQLGAVLLHDAVWLLPANARTEEQFQWLQAEIAELGGESTVWESRLAGGLDEPWLVRQFQDQAETAYREILDGLAAEEPDLVVLSRRYRHVQAQDYFPGELSVQVREALAAARRRLEG